MPTYILTVIEAGYTISMFNESIDITSLMYTLLSNIPLIIFIMNAEQILMKCDRKIFFKFPKRHRHRFYNYIIYNIDNFLLQAM